MNRQMNNSRCANEVGSKIEVALESNLNAQSNLLASLSKIATLKRKLSLTLDCCGVNNSSENRHSVQREEIREETMRTNKRRKVSVSGDSNQTMKKTAKGWELNANRKWLRKFFVDPSLSSPPANSDTLKRREWEGALVGSLKARYTGWKSEDIELLAKCTEESKKKLPCDSALSLHDEEIDFEIVHRKIRDNLLEFSLKPWQIKKSQTSLYASDDGAPLNGTVRLRHWSDYRNKYLYSLSPSINTSPFTEQESKALNEAFKDWENGQLELHQLPLRLDTSRTIFQCFKHIQMNFVDCIGKLSASEDELLLKYVAASGPQFVINHHTSTFLSQRFFPRLSPRQISNRLNTLLLNPNYKSEKWTDFEERMLVLGMKAFSESISPITKVAVSEACNSSFPVFDDRDHFSSFFHTIFAAHTKALLPHRAGKLIMDKWNRSLNPIYSYTPFTKEEDRKLRAAVKKRHGSTNDWKNVSQLFPSRNPQSLSSRYIDITRDEGTCTVDVDDQIAL